MNRLKHSTLLLLALFFCVSLRAAIYDPSQIVPPKPMQEFRGVWIATVQNIDWPSKFGLTTAQQKAQLISILDGAARLKLNAIIFQVRPACDAMYASKIEPWSEYLTGTMGRAPWPYYDPLAFAIEEAHKRGLELHAWFNPYRALHFSSRSPIATNHISRTHPELVKNFGKYLWLDPGEHDVQDYSMSVIMDVVKRYDIDGVQFDDYFYPDPASAGAGSDFPDEASWKKFGVRSGMSRDDWRRENVNTFVQRAWTSIKSAKPWAKFGISPFGIWRSNIPPQIRGTDAFTVLSADSRKWLMNGWVDYLAPQLYWPIDQKEQSFPVLLNWWLQQNPQGRYIWPGLAVFNADKWNAQEIPNQIRFERREPGVSGTLLYNAGSLMRNTALTAALSRQIFIEPALVPATPKSTFFDNTPPAKPTLITRGLRFGKTITVNWQAATNQIISQWIFQTKTGTNWTTVYLPRSETSRTLVGTNFPDAIAVSSICRGDLISLPAVISKRN
jgi:uncharacterized lipoprotein YddW (UPF0748 family)